MHFIHEILTNMFRPTSGHLHGDALIQEYKNTEVVNHVIISP
jgi:hypothetical protein